jgi:hypothetical protein
METTEYREPRVQPLLPAAVLNRYPWEKLNYLLLSFSPSFASIVVRFKASIID